jgi:uncharacterized protein (TIGR03083 family)
MRVVPVDVDELRASLRALPRRIAELVEGVEPATPVPGLDWTVGDVLAHLVFGIEAYREMALGTFDFAGIEAAVTGSTSPRQRGERINRLLLGEAGERDIAALSSGLEEATSAFVAVAAEVDPDRWFPTWMGYPMDVGAAAAGMLGEQLVHGFDIARSIRRRWVISPDSARLVHAGTADLIPHYVDPEAARGRALAVEIRIRGGVRYIVDISDGEAAVSSPPAHRDIDCTIDAEPTTFLLANYRRIGRIQPILRGRIRAGGRRPWRAGQLSRLLTPI